MFVILHNLEGAEVLVNPALVCRIEPMASSNMIIQSDGAYVIVTETQAEITAACDELTMRSIHKATTMAEALTEHVESGGTKSFTDIYNELKDAQRDDPTA